MNKPGRGLTKPWTVCVHIEDQESGVPPGVACPTVLDQGALERGNQMLPIRRNPKPFKASIVPPVLSRHPGLNAPPGKLKTSPLTKRLESKRCQSWFTMGICLTDSGPVWKVKDNAHGLRSITTSKEGSINRVASASLRRG